MKVFQKLVAAELNKARSKHPKGINSAHEGYAVMLEELEEFFEECRAQKHDPDAMLKELVQIAAMAQRTAEDVLAAKLLSGDVPDLLITISGLRASGKTFLQHLIGRELVRRGYIVEARDDFGRAYGKDALIKAGAKNNPDIAKLHRVHIETDNHLVG